MLFRALSWEMLFYNSVPFQAQINASLLYFRALLPLRIKKPKLEYSPSAKATQLFGGRGAGPWERRDLESGPGSYWGAGPWEQGWLVAEPSPRPPPRARPSPSQTLRALPSPIPSTIPSPNYSPSSSRLFCNTHWQCGYKSLA